MKSRRTGRPWISAFCVSTTLIFFGCATNSDVMPKTERAEQPISNSSNSREVLSGHWEYHEGEIMYDLVLDHQGNGTYDWQQGRFETLFFLDKMWKGIWIQAGNDREGGFEAQLVEEGMSARGKWWYTRIGNDHDPLEPGGQFTLSRTTENN